MTDTTPTRRHLTGHSPLVFTGIAIAVVAFARRRRAAFRARRARR